MDPSLTILQSYVNEECTLQVTAGEQNKNSQSIYRSGHLTMVKGGLVALQSPTSTNSVETRDSFQTTSLLCCRTVMDGVIDSWVPQVARPDDENKDVRIFSFFFFFFEHGYSLRCSRSTHRESKPSSATQACNMDTVRLIIRSRKSRPHLTNWARQIIRDKIWKD